MDSRQYGRICVQPNALARPIIEASLQIIEGADPGLEESIREILHGKPVQKPPEHQGGPETDIFLVTLERGDIEKALDILFDMEGSAVGLEASRIAKLVDSWNRMLWDD